MRRSLQLVWAWGPVVVWMIAIFIGSTDLLASHRTSRFIGPLLRWLKPDISDAAIQRVQFVVRKGGHLTVYAILAVLCQRALQLPGRAWPSPDHRPALLALLIASAYAVTDELHQAFVATRLGSGLDVLIDAAGALLGLTALWLWSTWRSARRMTMGAVADAPGRSLTVPP